jgi:alanyl-tRNA synthetase
VRAAEIRETFLSFFEREGHRRMPSASLVPSTYDPSVLLTTAGMQPFKPYFSGEERPPAQRLTSDQKCFRATDIENVGATARHLTFFEMLGNFSIGDYFKEDAVRYAWQLSTEGFGFAPERIWISVMGGDEELGLGADEEAIDHWRAVGVPDERIVRLGREDNFWQAGPTGPCGPCSELYLDRGREFGTDDDLPGDDTERFLEFWNLVFMQYQLHADGSLTDLPQRSIDTGLGLDRLAAILQDVPSVYETDHFRPIVALGDHACAADPRGPRTRDGVPPGRRRRAVERGPRLRPAPDHAAGDPAGPRARDRRPVPARAVRARRRDDGRRLRRAARRARDDRALGRCRGGGLPADARAG